MICLQDGPQFQSCFTNHEIACSVCHVPVQGIEEECNILTVSYRDIFMTNMKCNGPEAVEILDQTLFSSVKNFWLMLSRLKLHELNYKQQ